LFESREGYHYINPGRKARLPSMALVEGLRGGDEAVEALKFFLLPIREDEGGPKDLESLFKGLPFVVVAAPTPN
jgi:hypothetical protein